MAIAFVQTANGNTGANSASLTATFPGAVTQNNLMTAQAFTKADTSITNPSGWSTAIDVVNATNADTLRLAYKVAGASESSTVTFTTNPSDQSAIGIFEFSGTATASPLDKTASSAFATSVTTKSSGTTATTAQADEVCCVGYGIRGVITSPSLDNSFTFKNTTRSTLSGAEATIIDGYRIVSSTGAYISNASWTTAQGAMGAIATFKAAAAGLQPRLPKQIMNYAVRMAAEW